MHMQLSQTPLYIAAEGGYLNVVMALVFRGAKVDSKDKVST